MAQRKKNFPLGFFLFKSGSSLDFAGLENIALGILRDNIRKWGERLCLPGEVLGMCWDSETE